MEANTSMTLRVLQFSIMVFHAETEQASKTQEVKSKSDETCHASFRESPISPISHYLASSPLNTQSILWRLRLLAGHRGGSRASLVRVASSLAKEK